MTPAEQTFVLGRYQAKFARDKFDTVAVPSLDDIALPPSRLTPPASLAAICSTERYDRAAHAYGKSYPDYVRAMLGDYACAPDVVAYPRNEAEIASVMDWAGSAQASLSPFGGGSSVCGGVEHRRDGRLKAAVTLDLRHLGKVREIDVTSRAALIEGGAYGPSLEAQLKPHGLTLRHFPQSFEYSTLGGWIATRSGGHFSSLSRRSGRRPAGGDAKGRDRNAPAARLRRGAEPGPDVDRLGRHFGRDLAGLDAAAAAADIPRRRLGAVRHVLRRGARGPRHRASRALSVELPHPRSAGSLQRRRRRRPRRDHGAWVRIRRSSGRALDGAGAAVLRRSRRHGGIGCRRRR
jgi:hypothetical protein